MAVCCHSCAENTNGLQDDLGLGLQSALLRPMLLYLLPSLSHSSSLLLSAHKLKPACLVGLLTTSSSLKSTLSGESVRLIDHGIHLAIYPGLMSEGPRSSEQVSLLGRRCS